MNRILVALGLLLALLGGAGCGLIDTRPKSTYAELSLIHISEPTRPY